MQNVHGGFEFVSLSNSGGCLGAMAHACNPSTLTDQGRRIAQEFETSLGNVAKLHLYKTYKN